MASPPPDDRGTVFVLDTLIVRVAARAASAAQCQHIAFGIEAAHLAAPLAGDFAALETAVTEWLEPAIRFAASDRVTLVVAAAALNDGWMQVGFALGEHGVPADARAGEGGALPRAPTPAAFTTVLALAPGSTADGPLDGRRALLVHDLPDGGAELQSVLAGFGLRIDRVAPGAEAIERHAAAAASPDGEHAFVLLAGPSAGGRGLATAEALTDFAGAVMPGFVLLDGGLDAGPLGRPGALDVACVPAAPLDPAVLHGELLRLLLDQADAVPDAEQRRPRLRVLLAEDHALNQIVATDMLEALGLAVDVAADGVEAVRSVLGGRHDLVLMDVHMPVMDGLEATRRLRARPELDGLPIVAMTANAFAADLQACLAAGMNDHLVKPVDPTALRAMLARWLPRLASPGPAAATRVGPGLAAAPSIEGIDGSAGLRFFAGDPVAYRNALGRFALLYAAGLSGAPLSSVEALSRGRLRRDLHSLAGAASAVGATRLQQEATRVEFGLEEAAAAGDPAALERLDAGLRELAARISEALAGDRPVPF